MATPIDAPKLYTDLASWWPLVSPPAEYAEEAIIYWNAIVTGAAGPVRTVLELGCGGGSNAWHLKSRAVLTLVDRSPAMLAVSKALNPECDHTAGDMRTVRLGRQFDAVFIHDAIAYMLTEDDLRAALMTAWLHCAPDGCALFVPDCVRENFQPTTSHGGHEGAGRSLRFLAWQWDPDPDDAWYLVDHALLLRDSDGTTRVVHDRHKCGLFSTKQWVEALQAAGFEAEAVPWELPGESSAGRMMFRGIKRPK